MPRQTQRQCGPLRGKQADAAAQDHRHDRELVNVDEVKRHHPAGELRAAAHPDIPPGARFQAAYRLCRVLGRKNGVCVRRGCTVCEHLALHSHIRPRAGRELLRNLSVSRHAHQYGVHFGGKGGITIVSFKGFAVVGEVHPADAAVFVGNEAVKTHGEI